MHRLILTLALACSLALGASGAASAETIGGEQLSKRGVQVNPGPGAKPVPEIWAETWILVDATNGTVLAAKNSHDRRPPASTLKTLTALTVLQELTLDQTYVAKAKDTRVEGARAGLIAGKRYTVEDLLYGTFLRSGNDAATALARAPGSVKRTIERMNEVARQLQANDTTAKTPTGLDHKGQVSSAYDLALIARAGLARPDFAKFARTKTHRFPGGGGSTYTIYNQNRLLMGGFKGAIGVKTGFTSNAGRTFVGAATRKGTTLIFVGMGIHDGSASAARKALKWGFKNLGKVTPVGTMVGPIEAAGAASSVPESPTGLSDEELATAGLGIPPAGDAMAPWWFWLIIVLAIGALILGWVGKSRQQAAGSGTGAHQAPRAKRQYRPYQPL
jgi:D-alanyl-D-alanine carboxypeptidase (penicillin-binding protein 5/6)